MYHIGNQTLFLLGFSLEWKSAFIVEILVFVKNCALTFHICLRPNVSIKRSLESTEICKKFILSLVKFATIEFKISLFLSSLSQCHRKCPEHPSNPEPYTTIQVIFLQTAT